MESQVSLTFERYGGNLCLEVVDADRKDAVLREMKGSSDIHRDIHSSEGACSHDCLCLHVDIHMVVMFIDAKPVKSQSQGICSYSSSYEKAVH